MTDSKKTAIFIVITLALNLILTLSCFMYIKTIASNQSTVNFTNFQRWKLYDLDKEKQQELNKVFNSKLN